MKLNSLCIHVTKLDCRRTFEHGNEECFTQPNFPTTKYKQGVRNNYFQM